MSPIVFVHEFGHYIAARKSGIFVECFSIGFGPRLFGWKDRNGTEWRVGAIPFGGYVRPRSLFEEGAQTGLHKGPKGKAQEEVHPFKRIMVAFSGPLSNYIFSFVLFFSVFAISGIQTLSSTIGEVSPQSPAAAAGLMKGDRILSINDQQTETFDDVLKALGKASSDEPLSIRVRRGEENMSFTARYEGRLGVSPSIKGGISVQCTIPEALEKSWEKIVDFTITPFKMITGGMKKGGLEGPIGIARRAGDVLKEGDVWTFLSFMAILSVGLGFLNLLPLPILDGGRIVVSAFEWVIGRSLSLMAQTIIAYVGLAFLIVTFAILSWQDIQRSDMYQAVSKKISSIFQN